MVPVYFKYVRTQVLNVSFCAFVLSLVHWNSTLKNVNYLNINIYSYLETSGGQSSNLYLNVVHFFNTSAN
jgi:hypothetical protein